MGLHHLKTEQKVPILGSIPLIGELFKYTQSSKKKTELIVMLTPFIVDIYDNELNTDLLDQLPADFKENLGKRP